MRASFVVGILMLVAGYLSCVAAQTNVLASEASSKALAAAFVYDNDSFVSAIKDVDDKAVAAYLWEYKALLDYTASNNEKNYQVYMAASDNALDAVEGHKYEPTLTSNLQMHRCLVEMSMGSLWGGGIQFWKSYRSFKRGEESLPEYDGQLMLRGIFDVLLSQVPEKWKGLAGLFGFGGGNLQRGFAEIEQYHQKVSSVPGLGDESLLLVFANIFLSHDQRISDQQRSELRDSNTPVVIYAYVLSNGRNCMGEEADYVLSRLPQSVFGSFPLLIHQQAKFSLRRLDTKAASEYADKFLKLYTGTSCRNDAPLLKAYAALLEGRIADSKKFADEAAKMGFKSDVDKRTNADAKIFSTMDATLVKARFQFEYGDYDASLSTLKSFTPASGNIIEYYFRLGRAEEKLGHNSAALSCYDMTISMAGNDKRFFGPYAAVYAADMMLRSNDKARAGEYIAKAKTLNNGEFSKEIDQRISLALRAISGDK